MYSLALMPVMAVALGALLAGEPVTPEVVAGAVLVTVAVYVGAIRRSRDPASEPGLQRGEAKPDEHGERGQQQRT